MIKQSRTEAEGRRKKKATIAQHSLAVQKAQRF